MADRDDLLARLTAKQRQIARARPLPQATLRSMMDDFLVRYAHETTAIEGNTLTLIETQVVLEGITVGGKTLREHLEVLGVRDAWEWLQGSVQPQALPDEETILHLHRLLMKGILGDDAGRYRTVAVFIAGSMHVPPNPIRVPALMAAFVERFRERPADEHIVRYAARAHIELAGIHPFVDGNGRVCRLLVNLLLMREGWHTPASKGKPIGWTARSDWQSTIDLLTRYGGLKNVKPLSDYYTNADLPQSAT